VERLGLGVAALGAIELGEVVEGSADVGVVGAQRLLVDGQRALVERLGLGVATLGLIYICQPRDGRGIFGVVVAIFLASQGNVLLGYRNRFCVLALAKELTDLGAQGSKLIGTLCSGLVRQLADHKRQQGNHHDRGPDQPRRHHRATHYNQ
jgi:hypothetical protein